MSPFYFITDYDFLILVNSPVLISTYMTHFQENLSLFKHFCAQFIIISEGSSHSSGPIEIEWQRIIFYIVWCQSVSWYWLKMAVGQVQSDFSALCFDNKSRMSGVNECKCCINMKKELQELQDELSSVKLIIKLLHSERNSSECAGYRTIEPRNLIPCSYFMYPEG